MRISEQLNWAFCSSFHSTICFPWSSCGYLHLGCFSVLFWRQVRVAPLVILTSLSFPALLFDVGPKDISAIVRLFGWQSQHYFKRDKHFMTELHVSSKKIWCLLIIKFTNFVFGEKSNIDVLNWNFEELKRFFFFNFQRECFSYLFPFHLG